SRPLHDALPIYDAKTVIERDQVSEGTLRNDTQIGNNPALSNGIELRHLFRRGRRGGRSQRLLKRSRDMRRRLAMPPQDGLDLETLEAQLLAATPVDGTNLRSIDSLREQL